MRHPWGDAFELIVKSKDRFTPCGCHHAIYLLASHRNPKDEDPPAAWHPGRGCSFFRPDVEGRSPEDSGLPMDPPIPHDPARVSH